MERKLVAILAADVVGFSQLMGRDEARTLAALKDIESNIIEPTVHNFGGRIVKRMGDGYLTEFPSVVDSVQCAVEWQKQAQSQDPQLQFRIGINLGDVISESGDIYGDGVNITSRIEGLAEPGGISLSGSAYDHVKGKLPYVFTYEGKKKLKNIVDPIRIYQLDNRTCESSDLNYVSIRTRRQSPGFWMIIIASIGVLFAFGLIYFKPFQKDELKSRESDAEVEQQVSSNWGASIAVLPFKNLSSDQEQEYFSDGITNDIITDLSRFHDLLVASSSTAFSYKGKAVDAKVIGQNLGVEYLLEGSVQRANNKIRINAQLINCKDGTHIWAERYDREFKDIFELQADIVTSIVAALAINVSQAEQNQALRKIPQDLDAYDYYLRGLAHYNNRVKKSNPIAREMFAKAISLDPDYSAAYAGLGLVEFAKVSYGWTEFPGQTLERAFAYGQKAIKLDPNNTKAHELLSSVYTFQNKFDLAIIEAQQALKLNPNSSTIYSQLGWALLWSGMVDESISVLEISLLLDDASVRNAWYHLGIAYYLKGEYEKALDILEKGLIKRPDFVGYHIILAATYAQLDRLKDAQNSVDFVLRFDPFFKVQYFGTAFKNQNHRLLIADGLRKAGLQ
jgi:adenylate cyclase